MVVESFVTEYEEAKTPNPCIVCNETLKFGKMMDAGATSFWETEKGEADFGGAGSLCHGWSALPVYFYTVLDPSYRVEEE